MKTIYYNGQIYTGTLPLQQAFAVENGKFLFAGSLGKILYPLVILLLGYAYFRMLSRNLYKRSEENGKYLRLRYKVMAELRIHWERWVQRKDYKFFTCPSCKTTLRVPRGHGKIKIVCRKCGSSFTGKS